VIAEDQSLLPKRGGTDYLYSDDEGEKPSSVVSYTLFVADARRASVEQGKKYSKFDELLTSIEKSPEQSEKLSGSRKWVARNFYSDQQTLASLRLGSGLSQKKLGELCGIEQSHVSRYETGKHEPSITVAKRMSSEIGVDLDIFCEAWENTRERAQKTGEG